MKVQSTAALAAPRSALSRADFYRFFAMFGAEALDTLAPLLGMKREFRPVEHAAPTQPKADIAPSEPVTIQIPRVEAFHFEPWRMTQWQPQDRESEEVPAWYAALPPLESKERAADRSKTMPGQPPLLPWPALWPYLRGALGTLRESGEIHLGPLIDGVISGRWPLRVPRKRRLAWATECQVILDIRPQLMPFRADFESLIPPLKAMRGSAGLSCWMLDQGPFGQWRTWEDGKTGTWMVPPEGTTVLVLGDLGQYEHQTGPWLRFGQTLKRRGCRPVALVPCPRYLWHRELALTWEMAMWDLDVRLPVAVPGRASPLLPLTSLPDQAQKRLRYLASLLAPAIRVEPGLLRSARTLLPQDKVDVGSEYFFWNHPEGKRNFLAAALDPNQRKSDQQQFSAWGEKRCRALLEAIQAFHAPHSPMIAHEELGTGYRLLGQTYAAGEEYFLRMSRNPVAARFTSRHAYVGRMADRQAEQDWRQGDGRALTWLIQNREALEAGEIRAPEGLDPLRYPWVFGLHGQKRNWYLSLHGNQLRCVAQPQVLAAQELHTGAPLGRISEKGGLLTLVQGSGAKSLRLEREAAFELSESKVCEIKSLTGTWTLEPMPAESRPHWAHRVGCDSAGLFADMKPAFGSTRMRWLPPSPIRVMDRQGQVVGQWPMLQGCWMAEDQRTLFADSSFHQPNWVETLGVDDYGIFAEVGIENVPIRFRWIFPGTFLMGSPEDEPGRPTKEAPIFWGDETQHQVTHTRGFWLGETTVTQALWQAVMGKNPSDFKGEDLPVDSVSWNDAGAFLDKLNQRYPDLKLRLPTEAQWEYACRAGTTTAYHFGQSITTDQVNYYGNRPNEGSPKGAWRQTTVAVRALPANGWGLFQMHGNVRELCADWLGAYVREPQVDPQGPDGGRLRVLRGGGWYDVGRSCRSAVRDGDTPGTRNHYTGFRLARGQEALQQAPGRTEAGDRHRSGQGGGEST